MKASCIFIAFFLILGLSAKVYSQADSCSSNLDLNGQIRFDTTTLRCNPVWNAHGFILRYSQAGSNVWSFVLSAPNTNAYIAIGFSSDGKMVGTSSIVGWVGTDGTAVIKQYYLGGQSTSSVVPDQGSLQVLSNSSVIVSASSNIYLAFQLNTNQPASRPIYAIGPTGILPPAPAYPLTQHSDMVSTSINYATGKSETKNPSSNLRSSHGVLNMLGWGILIPIGAMAARYFKQWDPIWFYSHIFIQSFGFIFGIAGIITGLVLENQLSANVKKHKALGIFILVLGCLQVMAFLARPNKESKVRKYWNWYHHNVGRFVIIFAAVNVFYGIHLGNAGSSWNAGYGIVLAGLFIAAVVLEIRMWMKK
uniref:Cytochrome b561 and DOMON domain-containing protein n=1 Tax=Davidia involucrata TaxID=16924 RepID=A0A5B7BRG7_DAVIN